MALRRVEVCGIVMGIASVRPSSEVMTKYDEDGSDVEINEGEEVAMSYSAWIVS